MAELHETRTGKKFFEADVPALVEYVKKGAAALERIAAAIESDAVESAQLLAATNGEKLFVEMVWLVTNVDKLVGKHQDAVLAFATEDKATSYVYDEIHGSRLSSELKELQLARLNEWVDAETKASELIVGAFTIRALVVQL